jgi:hypothetical protein
MKSKTLNNLDIDFIKSKVLRWRRTRGPIYGDEWSLLEGVEPLFPSHKSKEVFYAWTNLIFFG